MSNRLKNIEKQTGWLSLQPPSWAKEYTKFISSGSFLLSYWKLLFEGWSKLQTTQWGQAQQDNIGVL